jgi:rhodanese-related sulfurtransferase
MSAAPEQRALPVTSSETVRAELKAGREIALIDVREEDPFAQQHPLFAAQLALSRLELDAPWRLPRRDVPVVVMDDGEGLAEPAARRLVALGYTGVSLLDGGLDGWKRSGGEIFRDVNVPSKAFGELVEGVRHTPSLSADEVKALLDARADVVVLDARRFDEYRTMSIPTGISVPGAELALRVRALAPDPATRVIVNCAGRTRSIIGTQSLVNFGIPNPVAALRNGTIGWTLAGHALDRGQQRRFSDTTSDGAAKTGASTGDGALPDPATLPEARAKAQRLADRAGAQRLSAEAWNQLDQPGRTVYRYDVRTPDEYAAGHLPGFGSAEGGQLVQETDVNAPVRGARIVLVDGPSMNGAPSDGVRAAMTAHWLAQMGWEVAWIDGVPAELYTDQSTWPPAAPAPEARSITPTELTAALARGEVELINLATSAQHVARHVPGAWWVLRSQLAAALAIVHAQGDGAPRPIVLTCQDGRVSLQALPEVAALSGRPVLLLEGGNGAWFAAGLPTRSGEHGLASPRIDRYRRPYEGTDAPREAMQAYLDWEFGLVAQLGRDATHGFAVLRGE